MIETVRDVSYSEKGLWFLHHAGGRPAECNSSVAIEIRSPIDVGRLAAGVDHLIQRHETFRTVYTMRDGGLRASVSRSANADFAAEPSRSPDAYIQDSLRRTHEIPFDTATGPFLRVRLWSRSRDSHVLVITSHHMTIDWISTAIGIQDIFAYYHDDAQASTRPMPAPYRDFVAEQRAWVDGPAGDRSWRYWQAAFPNQRPDAPITPSRVRDPSRRQTVLLPFSLAAPLKARIDRFARDNVMPPSLAMLGLWAQTLQAEGGCRTLSIGIPRSLRRSKFDETCGCFVNVLPLIIDMPEDGMLISIVNSIRTRFKESVRHQRFPIELLTSRMPQFGLGLGDGRTSLYDVTFNFVPRDGSGLTSLVTGADDVEINLGGLRVAPYPMPPSTGPSPDFSLHVTETQDRYLGLIGYDASLFDQDVAESVRDRFVSLAGQVPSAIPGRRA